MNKSLSYSQRIWTGPLFRKNGYPLNMEDYTLNSEIEQADANGEYTGPAGDTSEPLVFPWMDMDDLIHEVNYSARKLEGAGYGVPAYVAEYMRDRDFIAFCHRMQELFPRETVMTGMNRDEPYDQCSLLEDNVEGPSRVEAFRSRLERLDPELYATLDHPWKG